MVLCLAPPLPVPSKKAPTPSPHLQNDCHGRRVFCCANSPACAASRLRYYQNPATNGNLGDFVAMMIIMGTVFAMCAFFATVM